MKIVSHTSYTGSKPSSVTVPQVGNDSSYVDDIHQMATNPHFVVHPVNMQYVWMPHITALRNTSNPSLQRQNLLHLFALAKGALEKLYDEDPTTLLQINEFLAPKRAELLFNDEDEIDYPAALTSIDWMTQQILKLMPSDILPGFQERMQTVCNNLKQSDQIAAIADAFIPLFFEIDNLCTKQLQSRVQSGSHRLEQLAIQYEHQELKDQLSSGMSFKNTTDWLQRAVANRRELNVSTDELVSFRAAPMLVCNSFIETIASLVPLAEQNMPETFLRDVSHMRVMQQRFRFLVQTNVCLQTFKEAFKQIIGHAPGDDDTNSLREVLLCLREPAESRDFSNALVEYLEVIARKNGKELQKSQRDGIQSFADKNLLPQTPFFERYRNRLRLICRNYLGNRSLIKSDCATHNFSILENEIKNLSEEMSRVLRVNIGAHNDIYHETVNSSRQDLFMQQILSTDEVEISEHSCFKRVKEQALQFQEQYESRLQQYIQTMTEHIQDPVMLEQYKQIVAVNLRNIIMYCIKNKLDSYPYNDPFITYFKTHIESAITSIRGILRSYEIASVQFAQKQGSHIAPDHIMASFY